MNCMSCACSSWDRALSENSMPPLLRGTCRARRPGRRISFALAKLPHGTERRSPDGQDFFVAPRLAGALAAEPVLAALLRAVPAAFLAVVLAVPVAFLAVPVAFLAVALAVPVAFLAVLRAVPVAFLAVLRAVPGAFLAVERAVPAALVAVVLAVPVAFLAV